MTGNGHEKTQQILDRAVAELDIPGIAIEVKNADGSWFGAAGVSDRTTGAPRVPGEFLPIGSGGKGITAATLLTLEAEGRVDLADSVNKWLPGVMTNGYDGDRITIKHLLGNTSGLFATGLAPGLIGNYASRSKFNEHRFDEWTRDQLLKLAVSEPPVGQPGERFLYANGGFYIANAIIEEVTGNTYAEEVERVVLQPLGLTNTYVRSGGDTGYRGPSPRAYSTQFYKDGVDPADVTTENWESAFEDPGLEPLDVTEFNTSWETGNIVSTTSDAIRLLDALAGGTLLPPGQHRKMWTTIPTDGAGWLPNTRYGLGMFELDPAVTGGLTLRGMAGSYWGHWFLALSNPDSGIAFAFHTNTEAKNWDVLFNIAQAEFGFTMSA